MNKFDEMRLAIQEAKTTLNAADSVATDLARMLDGRLRMVESAYLLKQLKMQLRGFNAHTGQWSDT